jgi:hypothetical protein
MLRLCCRSLYACVSMFSMSQASVGEYTTVCCSAGKNFGLILLLKNYSLPPPLILVYVVMTPLLDTIPKIAYIILFAAGGTYIRSELVQLHAHTTTSITYGLYPQIIGCLLMGIIQGIRAHLPNGWVHYSSQSLHGSCTVEKF